MAYIRTLRKDVSTSEKEALKKLQWNLNNKRKDRQKQLRVNWAVVRRM